VVANENRSKQEQELVCSSVVKINKLVNAKQRAEIANTGPTLYAGGKIAGVELVSL
jgi:hypothetical protein